jgi:hypothetical protein
MNDRSLSFVMGSCSSAHESGNHLVGSDHNERFGPQVIVMMIETRHFGSRITADEISKGHFGPWITV